MKFTANLTEFHRALMKTIPAIPRKSTLPILEHIHLTLNENELQIIGTDQDIIIMTKLVVNGEESGSVLVPGKKLSDIVKALKQEGTIELSTKENSFDIKLKTAFGKYGLKGIDPEEYLYLPELFESERPNIHEYVEGESEKPANVAFFKRNNIQYLADKTVFAVSTDEFRPSMNGVYFQFSENTVNAVATDSFRLSIAKIHSEKGEYPSDLNIIIPTRAADLLKRVEDDVILSIIETRNKYTHARFDIGDSVIISRLIEEKFPAYETVIPRNNDLVLVINRNDFLLAIRRVAILTSTISNQIRLKITDKELFIIGEDQDTGSEAIDIVPCDFNGKELEIAFNHKYLDDALMNLEGDSATPTILMSFSEHLGFLIIRKQFSKRKPRALRFPVRLNYSLNFARYQLLE